MTTTRQNGSLYTSLQNTPTTGILNVEVELQSGTTQYLTGDGSTLTFNLTTPVLDGTRIAVFLNGVKQPIDEVWTYASSVVTFKIAPYSGSQVAIGYIDKKYKNAKSDPHT